MCCLKVQSLIRINNTAIGHVIILFYRSPEMLSLSADVKEKYEMELKDEGEFWYLNSV